MRGTGVGLGVGAVNGSEEYHTHHPVGFDRVKRENSKAMWMLGFYVVSFFGIFCGRIEGDHVSGRVLLDLA